MPVLVDVTYYLASRVSNEIFADFLKRRNLDFCKPSYAVCLKYAHIGISIKRSLVSKLTDALKLPLLFIK